MFNSIRGLITGKSSDTVYILTGGIEWDISVPAKDIEKLPPPGGEGRVYTWLYHKDDQMRLYGFADEAGRTTFLELIKVEGIGPRGGIKIMGNIDREELERALEAEDLVRLEQVPGLGKKTAQKMILSLKGKLTRLPQPASGPYGDLVKALEEMGYDRRQAAAAMEKAAAGAYPGLSGAQKEQAVFREAILSLGGQSGA
ncbi:MAG: Holliday junction branch migration protein RuvA [Treponema sp.]|jgi:Holliday junction DNA helicase RuvA|nr:Holliday junction branch migration protein RuvA [Treponema sp.]